VLQEREIERVGESARRRVDIRILTATHQDLVARVRQGLFREDLFYRLKVFPIHLPALRERREDIPLLAGHFVDRLNRRTGKELAGLSEPALRTCLDYVWPGNVRELENAIEHAFVLCRTGRIEIEHLPLELRQSGSIRFDTGRPMHRPQAVRQPLTAGELRSLLRACGWNKAEAARRVGISRTAVWKYMRKWGIPLQRETVE
jgi:DNA-binding NtrC family response regulator